MLPSLTEMGVARGGLAALALAVVAACTSDVRVSGALPLEPEPRPAVFLVATRHKAAIASSLERAGFRLADDLLEAPYYLRVTVGVDRFPSSCGSVANVKYELSRDGTVLRTLSAAGWTGSCEENVFRALSRSLMNEFRSPEEKSAA